VTAEALQSALDEHGVRLRTALAGFVLLVAFRAPPILVVALGVAAGLVRGLA
jgi:hypothetical protein